MPNAKIIVAVAAGALALGACDRQPQTNDQNIAIDDGVPDNQVSGNAEIETLPADESSTTPSSQLQNGYDSPDVNESAAGNSD